MEDKLNKQLDLPADVSHYSFRIAGHTHVQGKIKLGMLKHNDGNILKPLLNGDIRSARELSFYEQFTENEESDPILYDLRNFIPSFYGTWETTVKDTTVKYLCIEDVCGTFQNPSVLDIKIGRITYDPLASEEKIKKDTLKYPPVQIFGFRILGMKVYDQNNQLYISKDKNFGLSLKIAEEVISGLKQYFTSKLGQINCLILSCFCHKLLHLKNWFSNQRKFAFISSSILFVYEGNLSSWLTWMDKYSIHVASPETCRLYSTNSSKDYTSLHHADCSPVLQKSSIKEIMDICKDCFLHKDICKKLQESSTLIRVSMLDFAHVFPTTQEDSNYIFGLNNLITYWQQVMKTLMETYL